MQYMGSKNRISKEIVPIIQSYINENTKGYIEPFVGGANVIDKIEHHNKIGCDIHKNLIALLKECQTDKAFPDSISEDEYIKVKNNPEEYEDWYVGLVGFCGSFGAKYFGGYAGNVKDKRNRPSEAINNILKQRESLLNIKFINGSFLSLNKNQISNFVIYCDPPYAGTTKYNSNEFDYDKFWDWVREMSVHNIVLVSEYNAPEDFVCIWEKSHKTNLQIGKQQNRIEKLFIHSQ